MYNRNAQVSREQQVPSNSTSSSASAAEANQIRINGFQQVLEMLKVADPMFRESLLSRIGNKDPRMAKMLRNQLSEE